MMPGPYSFSVFVRGYVRTNVRPSVWMCVHVPVTLRLRHLYQVEFCSFIVRYPTVGASVYCGHISSCCFFFQVFKKKSVYAKHSDKEGWANCVDQGQIEAEAVWSGSTLFAILSVLLETFKDNQRDLVKFYVNYLPSSNIFGNYGIILHKKRRIPTYPTWCFLTCYPKHTILFIWPFDGVPKKLLDERQTV